MDAALALICGVLASLGVVLIATGLRHSPTASTGLSTAVGKRLRGRFRSPNKPTLLRWLVGIAGGVIALAITGMPLSLLVVPAAVVGLPVLLGAPKNRELALLEALDRWVRGLAAVLPTGRSVLDAVRYSARQSPPLLAPHLRVLVARMDERWSAAQALRGLADDLDSPDADAVVAALILAADRGGTGATATLNALADSISDRLRAWREIETERAKPRLVVRQVTLITAAVLAAAFWFGGEFFAPYQTPLGQGLLTILLAAYAGSLFMLRRMTRPPGRTRILSGSSGAQEPG